MNGKSSAELRFQFASGCVHTGGREKTENGFLIGGDAFACGLQLTHFGIRGVRIAGWLAQYRLHM
jgi:hypothetical protein